MRVLTLAASLSALVLAPLGAGVAQEEEPQFTAEFPLNDCNFQTIGGNPWFKLIVGRQLYLTNQRCMDDGDCDELVELWVTVLPEIRRIPVEIGGRTRIVRARIVEEYETEDGEPVELSRNFYAACPTGNDVYYFGEDVFDGDGNPLPDAWIAGKNGAQPGIIMPGGAFLLGSRYYQEVAPGVALDRAEHVAQGILVDVPAGLFSNCVEITETTPLEPGHESRKTYCPGIGLVQDGDLELTAIYRGKRGHDQSQNDD